MEKVDLKVEERKSLGSGASRRFRRQGKVPAILYGRSEPKAILVNSAEIAKIMHRHGGRNVILSLKINNVDETAIIRDIQRHPVTRQLDHIDFQRISLTDRITAEVSISITGTSEAVTAGGILMTLMHSIEVECLPMEIPDSIKIDISLLKNIGDAIHASEIQLPQGVDLKSPPDATVVTVQPPEKEEVAPVEAPVEGAVPQEPEVIAKGKDKEGVETAEAGKEAEPAKKEAAPKAKGKEAEPSKKEAASKAKGKEK